MEKTREIVVPEYRPGITKKSLTLTVLLLAVYIPLSAIVRLYTDKPSTFAGFVLPMIYVIFVLEFIGRLNPRMRFSPQEYAFIFAVLAMITDTSYFLFHAYANEYGLGWTAPALSDFAAFGLSDLRDFWSKAVPAVIVPSEPLRFTIGEMLQHGKAAGQQVPWSSITPVVFYWGLTLLFYSFISIFVTFCFTKPWVEEERLVFPLAIPNVYLLREAGTVSTGNKSSLFDISLARTKVFWALFVIGFVSSIYVVVSEILPVFPIGAWWGETNVPLYFLASLWPGTYAAGIFFLPQLAVSLMLTNDVLITTILGWIIFGLLYQGIGVTLGVIPYRPGMEFVWPWEDNPGGWLPFPYRYIGQDGVALSIALWMIYKYRKRIVSFFSTLWRESEAEFGVPPRLISALFVVGFFGWYLAMLIEQADPVVALLVPIWAFLFNIMYARVYAEVFWHNGTGWGDAWQLTYFFGQAVRGWPRVEAITWDSPNTNPAWFTIARHTSNFDEWVISFGSMSSGIQASLYKVAYDLKMRMRDLLVAMLIGLVAVAFALIPLQVYFVFNTKGGLSSLPLYASWWPWIAAGRCHRGYWVGAGITPTHVIWLLYGVGLLIGLGCYLLKSFVPFFWFINVPALYVSLTIVTYMWLTSLLALIIKFVAVRTVGIKRYEEYVMSAVAGLTLGFGAAWLFALLINFATTIWPRFLAFYQP
ncbi:MAG: DUF6785 family protein [Thermofilaceae archaeon]